MNGEAIVKKIVKEMDRRFGDFGQEMDRKLDNAVEGLTEVMGQRFDSLETRVGSLDAKVDSLETKVNSLETKVNSLETHLDKLTVQVIDNSQKLENTATKDNLRQMNDAIMKRLDEHKVILDRNETERLAANARFARIDEPWPGSSLMSGHGGAGSTYLCRK